eukprot:144974_1
MKEIGGVKLCGLTIQQSDQYVLQSYLTGWFYDPIGTSISDYLEVKGRPDLFLVVKRLIKKLGLHQLRLEHNQICKKASRKIDGVFQKRMRKGENKKNDDADQDKEMLDDDTLLVMVEEENQISAPSAPPLDGDDYIDVSSDGYVDVVAADIFKETVIEQNEEEDSMSATMDMDDDEDASEYVSVSNTTAVATNAKVKK